MNGTANLFVLVAEDRAHLRLAVTLADRVAYELHSWLADFFDPERADLLDPCLRRWQGFTDAPLDRFVPLKKVRDLCEQHDVPRKHGLGLGLQARNAEMALRLLKLREPQPDAVVLLCDADKNDPKAVVESLTAARGGAWPFPVIIGVCNPEAEAWYLNGYVHTNDKERQKLCELEQELGFDPCEHTAQLSSGRKEHQRDAKRVLGLLVGAKPLVAAAHVRAQRGIRQTDLDLLERRGQETGLSLFLAELRTYLSPCYGPLSTRP